MQKLISGLSGGDSQFGRALEIALVEALKACLGVVDVEVKLSPRIRAICFYQVGKDISLGAAQRLDPLACEGDIVSKVLELEELPERVIRRVKRRFPSILEELRAEEAYWTWKQRVHQAVEGVIVKADSQVVWVDLGGQIGIMPRSQWIPKEVPGYIPGKAYWLYVLKAQREGRALRIYLSRNSIGLPVALLREMVPGIKARCIRRIAGARSWLVVNRRLEKKVLAELGKRLGGEWVGVSNG